MNEKEKRKSKLNDIISFSVLFFADMALVSIISFLSFSIYDSFTIESYKFHNFINFYLPMIVVLSIFLYEGIYFKRYDFWQETRIITRSLILSFLIIILVSVLLDYWESNNIFPILISFILLVVIIPMFKYMTKKRLFERGYWKKGVKLLTKNKILEADIFTDKYLGYVKSRRKDAEYVFIDSSEKDSDELKKILEEEIISNRKVLFLPILNNYQFSSSNIYELTNSRTSLIVLDNKLMCSTRNFFNKIYNLFLAIIISPFLLPIVGIIALLINQDSKGPIFFKQKRLGKDGKNFMCYKFRTMYTEDVQEELLSVYLEENPHEIKNYEIYCKYENDPRITKVGNFLRKTSLDELAQIINVLKGEMNFVGPRPYLVSEEEKMGKQNCETILKVNPGITGLWQVSGRNELTFDERVKLEKWYVQNWSLWTDIMIFIKTFGVVLNKVGAR